MPFWTQNEADQIKAKSFRSPQDFANGIERKAKDITVENNDGWENWAVAMVTFRIGEEYNYNGGNYPNSNHNHGNNNGNNNSNSGDNIIINNLVQTVGNYNNVYIVVFGANVYQLKKTNDDAELFIQMMRTTLDVPAQNTRLYKDALYSDFEEGFEWLSDNAKANDLVLFYYSGHGTTLPDDNNDEGAGADGLDEAIVPYDYTKMSFDDASKYIRDDQLKEWFDNIQAFSIVTVFDSCFSGGMYKSFSQGGMLNARPKFLTKGKFAGKLPQYRGKGANKKDISGIGGEIASGNNKRVLIAASKEKQYAQEIPGKGGVLTIGLLEALTTSRPATAAAAKTTAATARTSAPRSAFGSMTATTPTTSARTSSSTPRQNATATSPSLTSAPAAECTNSSRTATSRTTTSAAAKPSKYRRKMRTSTTPLPA